jgi:hypothetical protein
MRRELGLSKRRATAVDKLAAIVQNSFTHEAGATAKPRGGAVAAAFFVGGFSIMAIVALDEETNTTPDGTGGSVFYQRGGKVVGRAVVVPVDPRTDAQLRERSQVAAAAKRWAYSVSSANKALWAASSFCNGLSGFPAYVWLWSLLRWVEAFPDGDVPGDPIDPPEISSCDIDPGEGSVAVTLSAPGLSSSAVGSVALPRPLRSGRMPRRSDSRILGPASVGTETDFTDAYVGRFGGLPTADQLWLMWARVGDPGAVTASCAVQTTCPGGGGGCSAVASPDTWTMDAYDCREISFTVGCDDADPLTTWEADYDQSLWNLSPETGFSNNVPTLCNVCDYFNGPGVYTVPIRWFSDETPSREVFMNLYITLT